MMTKRQAELDSLFAKLYAFRASAIMLNREGFPDLHIVAHMLGLTDDQREMLEQIPAVLEHAKQDYLAWVTMPNDAFGKARLLNSEVYRESLEQRQRLLSSWWSRFFIEHLKPLNDVMDLGGGSGFLASLMVEAHPDILVRVYDRPTIIEGMKWGTSAISFEAIDLDNPEASDTDNNVVFLGEVLHGKSTAACDRVLRFARSCLARSGRVIVTELTADTPLSRLFDIQMAIHTPAGRLYSELELMYMVTRAGFSNVRSVNATPYHFAVIGEKT